VGALIRKLVMEVVDAVERRRNPKPRLTITEILNQMQQFADEHHDGDLQNNTMSVFSKLSADSKRTFLRRSLMTLWETQIDLARSGYQEIIIEDDMRIFADEVIKERNEIEAGAPAEKTKLAGKVETFAIYLVLIVIVGIGVYWFFSGPSETTAPASELSWFQRISKAINYTVDLNKK